MNETVSELMQLIQLEPDFSGKAFDPLKTTASRYVRDMKVNLSNALVSDHLSSKEAALLALAVVANNKNSLLLRQFTRLAEEHGAEQEEIAEAIACASLLAANNVFYRFRHFVNKQTYQDMPGKIRMNIMIKPVLGKELFELMSLAVSAVNGCEMCVKAHENSVLSLGSSEARVWDAIRLASVIVSLDRIIY